MPQIVDAWESRGAACLAAELAMPRECPGKTYGTVFRELNAVNSLHPPRQAYIFWSDGVHVTEFGNLGFLVRFPHRTKARKLLSCWIAKELDGYRLPVDIERVLRKATIGEPAILYVYGQFQWNAERQRFVLDVELVSRVCAARRRQNRS